MRFPLIIEFYFVLIFSNHRLRSSYFVQADSTSCRKQVECFVCDSRETPACEDSRNFAHMHIPTRLCDDYCLKMWTRENESIADDDQTSTFRYVRRDCHKIVRYHIKKAETCYRHKKHQTDSLCLCGSDRCNSSISIRLKRTHLWIFILFSIVLMFFPLVIYY